MSHTPAGSRFWLMDYFGDVLDQDTLRDTLARRAVFGHGYPGIFFFTDNPVATPYDVDLRKAVSLPMPLPALQAVATGRENLIALKLRGSAPALYLTSFRIRNDPNQRFRTTATTVRAWEHFLPISEALLHTFLILGDTTRADIRDEEGNRLPPLQIQPGQLGAIGTLLFPLSTNVVDLETVAALHANEETVLTLQSGDVTRRISVTRLAPSA